MLETLKGSILLLDCRNWLALAAVLLFRAPAANGWLEAAIGLN